MRVLERAAWERREREHRTRVEAWTAPHLARRRRGVAHPVEDFLFTYYSHSPAKLARWHPGVGTALADAGHLLPLRDHVGVDVGGRRCVAVDPAAVEARAPLIEALRRLLAATAGRSASYGCFGMHEWAMVYRLESHEVRHSAWPLRLGANGTDEVVESHRIACTHFDAFRFFTQEARPLNTRRPAAHDRADFEQPGCLHAGMDLYKHAYRLAPLVPSELVADCFELARDIRTLDMRAAPYDLSGVRLADGTEWTPVRVETPAGKREYAEGQRLFAERAAPLRQRLIDVCDHALQPTSAAT